MTGQYIKRKIKQKSKKIIETIKKIPYNFRRGYNKKQMKSRDFTVISNNCWAGKLYQYLDMPYLSPTIGLYFFADDYIRFVKDIRRYLSFDLIFITVEESKYKNELIKRRHDSVPIARIDDVEIVFLHYKTQKEAEEKWNRRKQRINWDNLIIKFSKMNFCTEEHLKEFSEIPYSRKFILNNRKPTQYKCEYYWNGKGNEKEIFLDTNPFPGNLCLRKMIKRKNENY